MRFDALTLTLSLFACGIDLHAADVSTHTAAVAQTATGCAGAATSPSTAPSQAVAAGFSTLAFADEFNSADTISVNNASGYKWYPLNFFNPQASLPTSSYSVGNGCLIILSDASGYSDGLATASPTNTLGAFQYGYFEARIQFNPKGSEGSAWPAFWSYALEATQGESPFAELDFMEAYPQGTSGATVLTTVHQWTTVNGTNKSVQQANDVPTLPAGTNLTQFHIYGCLWTRTSITWYLDNKPLMTQAVGPGTPFTALGEDHMFVILGTGKQWPMTVDYVHVWQ